MTVTEAVRKFEKLERMCPFLKLIEKERVLRMMDMFHPDIAIFAETDEQLTMVMECYEKALHAKFRLNQLNKEKAKNSEAGRKAKRQSKDDIVKPTSSLNKPNKKKKKIMSDLKKKKVQSKKRSYVLKAYCRRCRCNHIGKSKRNKVVYYYYDQKGHLARNCPNKKSEKNERSQKA